ncbi:MAG: NHL repeat-containing protein [Planctomycetota bacterium]|nr:NHL repeat-containing protein [Planctomycetota bacterium]
MRCLVLSVIAVLTLVGCAGCVDESAPSGTLEKVWGRRGLSEGRFQTPRAIAIDTDDLVYIVDKIGRIQVFTTDGDYLRGWRTPAIENGKPCGMTIDDEGLLVVADTHYFRVLFYKPDGTLLEERTIGGVNGQGEGEFHFLTDVVQDSQGNYYVGEYGEHDRIQKFSRDGRFLLQWGGHGREPGKFVRPQGITVDADDRIWVADACNHRIQIFDETGQLLNVWGEHGKQVGQLSYPYGIELDGKGHVYVCEFGNNRVQKFTAEGESLGYWGTSGRREGELHQPWGLVQDSQGRIHVLDTYNHRVQRIRL